MTFIAILGCAVAEVIRLRSSIQPLKKFHARLEQHAVPKPTIVSLFRRAVPPYPAASGAEAPGGDLSPMMQFDDLVGSGEEAFVYVVVDHGVDARVKNCAG